MVWVHGRRHHSQYKHASAAAAVRAAAGHVRSLSAPPAPLWRGLGGARPVRPRCHAAPRIHAPTRCRAPTCLPACRLAFDTIEKIVREHFNHITETETTTFTDCVNCLIAFTNNPHSLDVALNSIAFLR